MPSLNPARLISSKLSLCYTTTKKATSATAATSDEPCKEVPEKLDEQKFIFRRIRRVVFFLTKGVVGLSKPDQTRPSAALPLFFQKA